MAVPLQRQQNHHQPTSNEQTPLNSTIAHATTPHRLRAPATVGGDTSSSAVDTTMSRTATTLYEPLRKQLPLDRSYHPRVIEPSQPPVGRSGVVAAAQHSVTVAYTIPSVKRAPVPQRSTAVNTLTAKTTGRSVVPALVAVVKGGSKTTGAATSTTAASSSGSSVPTTSVTVIGNYVLLKTIGKGNFAKVKLARHTPTGMQVAVKIIDKTKLTAPNYLKVSEVGFKTSNLSLFAVAT
jgi:hypothetical protein